MVHGATAARRSSLDRFDLLPLTFYWRSAGVRWRSNLASANATRLSGSQRSCVHPQKKSTHCVNTQEALLCTKFSNVRSTKSNKNGLHILNLEIVAAKRRTHHCRSSKHFADRSQTVRDPARYGTDRRRRTIGESSWRIALRGQERLSKAQHLETKPDDRMTGSVKKRACLF